MGRIIVTSLILTSSLLQAYPTPVDFTGELLRWNVSKSSTPIRYQVKGSTEDLDFYLPWVEAAADMWNQVPTSYLQLAKADTDVNITLHLDNSLDGSSYSSGYATFDEYEGTTPVHCAIHILVGPSVSGLYFAKTALHELGHCLGLGHSLVPEAVMSYELDKNGFRLDTDDMAAVSRLYPEDGTKPGVPLGCSVGGATRPLALLWFLIPLFYVVRGLLSLS